MNKILIVGRLVRDPETQTTGSGIKYTRFTVAVSRQFGQDQVDFIPIVAWRNQADFIDRYMNKGSLISVEGRFTSSSYKNNDGQNITRYEVTADRVQSLETKAQAAARNNGNTQEFIKKPVLSTAATQVISFEEENKPDLDDEKKDVPWELDL